MGYKSNCFLEVKFIQLRYYRVSDKTPSYILPTKGFDHRFIIGQGTDAVYLLWPYDTAASSYYAQCLIVTLDYNCPGNNFNDARADACGRVWTGE